MIPLDLPGEGVRVWRADLDVPAIGRDTLAQTLSEDERARASRFHRPRDRDRFVTARGLLRVLLGDALDCHPPDIRFRYNAWGKPALEFPDARLGFNLSHSDSVTLFALARHGEVGVDIERIHPKIRLDSLAARFLPAAEADTLGTLPPVLYPDAFTQAWVRREAYLKALGTGFSSATDPLENGRWACFDLNAGPDYCAALVVSETMTAGTG